MGPTSSLIENFSHSLVQGRQTEKISSIDPISSFTLHLLTRNVFHAKWIRQYEKNRAVENKREKWQFQIFKFKHFKINWREISNKIRQICKYFGG